MQARKEAEREAISIRVAAEAEKNAAIDKAEAVTTAANAEAERKRIEAGGEAEAEKLRAEAAEVRYRIDAAGETALNEARNMLSAEQGRSSRSGIPHRGQQHRRRPRSGHPLQRRHPVHRLSSLPGRSDFQGWYQALDMIAAMDISRIVPGHGPLSTKKDLAQMREYLTVFDAKARELGATLDDPEEIAQEMLKVLPPRSDGAFIVNMNISTRYLPQEQAGTK